MLEILKIAAQYTFVIQALLFPVLIIFSIYVMYWLLTNKKRKLHKKQTQALKETDTRQQEVLTPLKCNNCGSILIIDDNNDSCMSCGSTQDVPPHYSAIFKHRKDIEAKIVKAYEYWKKANRITSPFNRGILLFLFFWFITVFIILIITDDKEAWRSSDKNFYYSFLQTFGAGSIGTLFFWALNFLVIRGLIGPKLQKHLPEKVSDLRTDKEEVINCSQCSAPVHFSEKSVGSVCQYCGAETYRVNFSRKIYHKVTNERTKADFSLIEAMEKFEEAKEDAISSGVILPIIFIVLPAIAVFVFYLIPNLIKNGIENLF
ncbi:MAG: hypothetical protein K0S53_1233 [Bacteroidetes bacterium]|jgi:predicted RNA-binding Zn-ribbon protein involved in translation (DUF1610 family)|nr:hypothetical protein [Bacteroidota bacterium]MDF2452301.1 hypothetical protein [Bacteroidota bacterium]